MASSTLPRDITSYDLLKLFAVITMIIDHIGIYFFPDEMWWRTIGRLSFPVWLFLIGYARSRDISSRLIIGAVLVFASNIVAGMGVIPFSILVTIIAVRLTLDPLMKLLSKSAAHLWVGSAALFIIALPSFIIFEFGALAFVFAVFGYLLRHKQDEADHQQALRYGMFACLGYIFLQSFAYALAGPKLMVLAGGMAAVGLWLARFKSATYPALSARVGAPGRWFIQLCGRRTLEIYVLHLIVFKIIAVIIGVEGFAFMQWGWVW